jgi:prepilin-type N-terminal cleavage/methylation domain-containing protein
VTASASAFSGFDEKHIRPRLGPIFLESPVKKRITPHLIRSHAGLTLVEVLVAITILSILMVGLHQTIDSALSSYREGKNQNTLLNQAHFAMERMVMFIEKAQEIKRPAPNKLEVPERVLDTFINASRTYWANGDGILDADFDSDGLVDEGDGDNKEWIKWDRNKDTFQIIEKMPDRRTADQGDHLAETVICEHVKSLEFTKMASNLVEIQLVLNDGKEEVSLKTRVKARFVP